MLVARNCGYCQTWSISLSCKSSIARSRSLCLPSFARFASLTSLELLVGPWERGPRYWRVPIPPPNRDMLDSISAACSSCPHLRRLHLSSTFHHLKLATLIDDTRLLRRLPSTLQSLDLPLLPMTLATLLDFLAKDVSPSLHRLQVQRPEDPVELKRLQEACCNGVL